MKNKDLIIKLLKEHELSEDGNGLSTLEIADSLGLQRTNVSSLLNKLVESGTVIKLKTWPVTYKAGKNDNNSSSVLNTIIGSDNSMKNVIRQIRAAVLYPNKSLNTMILGPSGSGKSTLVSKMFYYAVEENVIKKGKKLVTFNCLDYKNNIEELKRDFNKTLISAEDTYFFVENIDYLEHESKNILFHLMDYGCIKLEDGEHNLNTTVIISLQNDNLKDEYIGHTPIVISIPAFNDWLISDKLEMIQSIFSAEASKSQKKIVINSVSIIALLMCNFPHNIKELENEIIKACANAYVRSFDNKDGKIEVIMSDFSDKIRSALLEFKKHRIEVENSVELNKKYVFTKSHQALIETTDEDNIYDFINQRTRELRSTGINDEDIGIILSADVNNSFKKYKESLVPSKTDLETLNGIVDQRIIDLCRELLKKAEEKLQKKYSDSVFYGLCIHLNVLLNKRNQYNEIKNNQIVEFIENNRREYYLASDFASDFKKTFGIKLSINEIILIGMFLCEDGKEHIDNKSPSVLIAMHGTKVASGILEICKSMSIENVYAFDLPLSISPLDAYDKLKKLIKSIDYGNGIIAICDTGSIKDLLNMATIDLDLSIKILEIPFTLFMLDVCRKISNSDNISDAFRQSIESYDNVFIKHVNKNSHQKAIVTMCLTGEGSAVEIKKQLENTYDLKDISIIPVQLENKEKLIEKLNKIGKDYDILCIISAFDPKIKSIPFVPISTIFSKQNDSFLNLIGTNIDVKKDDSKIINKEDYQEIFDNLKSSISDDVISGHEDVYIKMLNNLNKVANYSLVESDIVGLLVHLICAVYRIVSGERTPYNPLKRELYKKHKDDWYKIKDVLSIIENEMQIEMDDNEISYLVQMIEKYNL